ncbi:MAG: hypothetical protein ACK5H1_06920 [Tenacibaculum sp.]
MLNKILNYLLITILSTTVLLFTSCFKDKDDLPVEKTEEEIRAENLAEFKELIGPTGISTNNNKFSFALTSIPISKLTEEEFDKLDFLTNELFPGEEFYFKFDGKQYIKEVGLLKIQGEEYDFKKEGDVFTLYVKTEHKKELFFDGEENPEELESELKVIYNAKTKLYTIIYDASKEGIFLYGLVYQCTAGPYKENTAKAAKKSLTKNGTATLTGVHYVNVNLIPKNQIIALPVSALLRPWGYHYIKFTPKSNGITQIQFCDAKGNVSGENYYYSSTNHFWKNHMPMSLNLHQVDFTYNSNTGTISQGSGVLARAKRNYNPIGIIPPVFNGILSDQESGSRAAIIPSNNNTADNFKIEVKLDFDINFHCVISK